jgi:hypothetical protein
MQAPSQRQSKRQLQLLKPGCPAHGVRRASIRATGDDDAAAADLPPAAVLVLARPATVMDLFRIAHSVAFE